MTFEKYISLQLLLELIIKVATEFKIDNVLIEAEKLTKTLQQLRDLVQNQDGDETNKNQATLPSQLDEANKSIKNLLKLILYYDNRSCLVVYSELEKQLYDAIHEGSLSKFAAVLSNGQKLFVNGININQNNINNGSFLVCSLQNNQLEIAKFLLEHGADPNIYCYGQLSALHIAIKNQDLPAIQLLFAHGVKIDNKAFYCSIQSANIEIVKILVANGANLEPRNERFLAGDTLQFKSPLKFALMNNQLLVAKFLFSEIKKNPELLRISLLHFIHYAPLELLQSFLEDNSLSTAAKLAIPVPTTLQIGGTFITTNSVDLLLKRLLKEASFPQERLVVLKLLVQQLMTLDHLETNIEKEDCYKDKETLKILAKESNDSPISHLAKKILNSLQTSSKQGSVAVAYGVFNEVIVFALSNQCKFTAGIKFLRQILKRLDLFKKEHQAWPDMDTIQGLIELEADKLELTNVIEEPIPEQSRTLAGNAMRFRAMVGSSIFSKINPGLPKGGDEPVASQWYKGILTIIIETLADLDMLKDEWNKTKVVNLLQEISQGRSVQISTHENLIEREAIGFQLDMPDHFIPGILYRDAGYWRYTVMCRGFLQSKNGEEGAVEFIIPAETKAEVFFEIMQKVTERKHPAQGLSDLAIHREIYYRLLTHFLYIEKLTGSRCRYSTRCSQKPYKGPTCFASNFKPVLQLLLHILPKTTTTKEQWQKFNNKIKIYISEEMKKAGRQNDNLNNTTNVEGSREQNAYKLVTTLLRWLEINQFNPTSETEVVGKEATMKHVLEHSERLGFC